MTAERLADPAYAALVAGEFSQLTPEWQLKMEYVLQDDGALRFDAPDAIAAFAKAQGMRFFGHTLVWYAQSPAWFERLDGRRSRSAKLMTTTSPAWSATIRRPWPGTWSTRRWRRTTWHTARLLVEQNLGQVDYMRRAYEQARAAAPDAVLLLNDYNLESLPKKRAAYLGLAEQLFRRNRRATHRARDAEPSLCMPTSRQVA